MRAAVSLASQSTGVQRTGETDERGGYTAGTLPFGPYAVTVERSGWAVRKLLIRISSEVPVEQRVTLELAPVGTTVTVRDSDTLLDPGRVAAAMNVGRHDIETRTATTPTRSVLELVNRQPGWLLEANGVLHPRGAEYDTQYVIDGIPITDNRSPAFAPAFDAEEIAAMRVLTAGYPAEYGRKMGGVVELTTVRDAVEGFRTRASVQGGSFGSVSGYLGTQGTVGRSTFGLSAQGARTDRFLDPPTEDNFSNQGTTSGVAAHFGREVSAVDRVRFYVHRKRNAFLVPNEVEQQAAGQRQDRDGHETMGQASWSRVLSPRWVLDVRGMGREVDARLWSNSLSTPIVADQDRGFREVYLNAGLSASTGRHSVKFGGEFAATSLREQFSYKITDEDFFAEDGELEVPLSFRFRDARQGRECSAYAQDSIRAGNLTVNLGVRWDRYRLLVSEDFVSPRAGVAWTIPGAGLVFRGSYDRAVTTPAIENLLLASSSAAQALTDETAGLPLRPARGNFVELGLSKSILGRVRLDASWYRRDIRNFADDDVFLNTGISFPVSFDRASISGVEVRLEVPRAGRLSGFASYSNLSGTGHLPLTGGLFLDEDARELLESTDRFRITQDQRNTVQTRLRFDATRTVWAALGYWYNSGLPVELEGEPEGPASVLAQVDFERGRVKPSWSLDASAGWKVWERERRSVSLQADLLNIDRSSEPDQLLGFVFGYRGRCAARVLCSTVDELLGSEAGVNSRAS